MYFVPLKINKTQSQQARWHSRNTADSNLGGGWYKSQLEHQLLLLRILKFPQSLHANVRYSQLE
jgi:hypothetical protein